MSEELVSDVLKLADEAERLAVELHKAIYRCGDWKRDPETRDVAPLIDRIREQLGKPEETD